MRILHYFLGFPPFRSGGLTRFSVDLMEAQSETDEVFALWPGTMVPGIGKPSVKSRGLHNGIHSYEMINPLPVPLDEGVKDIDKYTKKTDVAVFIKFLKKVYPDIIHIHTLMGLYEEFVDAAKLLKIKLVFTTHDYFGICPKVTLYRNGSVCEDHNCDGCESCNCRALSLRKITVLQSPLYRKLKTTDFVTKLRRKHRTQFFIENEIQDSGAKSGLSGEYRRLRRYYTGILEKIDIIHFNSTLSETVYKKYMTPAKSQVISITNKGISDNRNKIEWTPSSDLNIVFLSPTKASKGYDILIQALDGLWSENIRNFHLQVFFPVPQNAEYLSVQPDGFSHSQLEELFRHADVLAAPSIWYETFGFTVLEALSYGVPVIVSDHVGACDIVRTGGLVVEAGSVEELKKAVMSLTVEKQKMLRDCIKNDCSIKEWSIFVEEMKRMYKG